MFDSPTKYFHRDLSWLRFNHRVLQEAADNRNPLYERIKFLAIFSSNLDEFYKVRVSDIRQIKKLDKPIRKKLISKPNKLLKAIKTEVVKQQEEFGRIYHEEVIPALQMNGVKIVNVQTYKGVHKEFIDKLTIPRQVSIMSLFHEEIEFFPENDALYLLSEIDDQQLAWVKVDYPDRFIVLEKDEGNMVVTFVDDAYRYLLSKNYNTTFYAVKISRDADLYLNDEYSGNLVEKIKESLTNRETGQVTRMLVDDLMPDELLEKINTQLDLSDVDIVPGGRYHNLKDLFSFPTLDNPSLFFTPYPPLEHPQLRHHTDLMTALLKKDYLLHFPYQSFQYITDFIQQAAQDPEVHTIRITLYRVSSTSAIGQALVHALDQGKRVFVFIETKARFDEANNLKWGDILAEKGAIVQYSFPGIKVHSKIFLVEKDDQRFAYVGTGNFNEKTATVYTDYGLLTADPVITKELEQVFNVLERKIIIPNPQSLMVSPYNTRNTFVNLVENEIRSAQRGKEAYIIIKMNSLQDTQMIKLLYKANNAGVKIRLLIRGICCLVPGIEGQSERITVTSIVDRFLEHCRVYVFANKGKEKLYIGSADWMTRNLDHRIEVLCPIRQRNIFDQIRFNLDLQLNDVAKSRIIDSRQSNEYLSKSSELPSSQNQIYHNYIDELEIDATLT